MHNRDREPPPSRARPQIMHGSFSRLCVAFFAACVLASAQTPNQPHTPHHKITIDGRVIGYEIHDGLAITEGDIILGAAAELEAAQDSKNPLPRGAAIYLRSDGTPAIWPDGTLYYVLPANFPNPQRVTDAIAHWNTNTPLKLLPRTGQASYVQFTSSSDGCYSNIGMTGGRQTINLASGCPLAAAIHEIGHAFGLMHEQSRADRNAWVTVLYENIDSSLYDQFGQVRTERDSGYYDFDSIMHYSPGAFSLFGATTIETVPPGILIGQRIGLSAGDIDNVVRTYGITPSDTTVTTMPSGLSIVVDGQRFTSPHAFSWGPGSSHSIAVDPVQDTGLGSGLIRQNYVRWTDGGAISHTFTANPNQTVVAAEFQQLFKVQGTVGSGNGSVTVSPPAAEGFYVSGSKVTVTANPAPGQQFIVWTNGTANYGIGRGTPSFTFEVRGSVNFPATFTTLPVTTFTSNVPGNNITVDGTGYYSPVSFQWADGSSHSVDTNLT
ncbi:MAG: M12 family metallopeptidase, partial [Acidobacteriota bacterium]